MISACDLQFNFNLVIADFTHEQVFNCDETGLQFCLLLQIVSRARPFTRVWGHCYQQLLQRGMQLNTIIIMVLLCD